jgi:adhesin transport system outer membrane protein
MKMKSFAISLIGLGFASGVSATSLNEAITITLKTHPDVLAASSERNAVYQQVEQARAGYLPTIDIAIGTGFESSDNPNTRASTGQHRNEHMNRDEASIQLRQMLFDGMATQNEEKRQLARTDSRSHTVMGTAENTALEASRAYVNVLRTQKLVELAANNLVAHERTFDQIELRSERGVGRRADLDQSRGRLALAKANLIAEESKLRDAETDYLRIVGNEPQSLEVPYSPVSMIPNSVQEAVDQAINTHPTLKSASSDVDSAHAQYDTAQSPFYPRLDFEVGASANNDLDGVNGHNNDVTAMFRLRYNLLNGGKDSARSQETAFLINQATEIRNNTHRQVEQSVRLSWNALQTVNEQLDLYNQYAISSENSRNAYQQQFNLGQRTLLDLLDSENELFSARQNLVNATYDQYTAMYRVLNSMGILLEALQVQLPEEAMLAENNQ